MGEVKVRTKTKSAGGSGKSKRASKTISRLSPAAAHHSDPADHQRIALEIRLAEQTASIEQSREHFQAMAQEWEIATRNMAELEGILANLEQKIVQADQVIRQRDDALSQLTAERSESETKTAALEIELQERLGALQTAQSEIDRLIAQSAELQEKLQATQSTVQARDNDINRYTSENAELEDLRSAADSRMKSLEGALRSAQNDLQRLSGEAASFQALAEQRALDCERLAETVNVRDKQLTAASSQVSAIERELESASQESRDLVLDFQIQKRILAQRHGRIVGLKTELNKANTELRKLKRIDSRQKRRLKEIVDSPIWAVVRPIQQAWERQRLQKVVNVLRRSRLFDEQFYLRTNPDVAIQQIDPIRHYLEFGADELRDPNPLFSNSWYLEKYPDVAQAGINPLLHYIEWGGAEGRDPHPLFNARWYLASYPDVAAAHANPLQHYLEHGAAEGRNPNQLFDTAWYMRNQPILAGGINPLVHYATVGTLEGADPHPLFDTTWYVEKNRDVASEGTNPLAHFLRQGGQDGLSPHPLFDSAWYLKKYPNVAAKRENPLVHYLFHGGFKGRDPNPNFDSNRYLKQHPEAAQARVNPLVHFVLSSSESPDPRKQPSSTQMPPAPSAASKPHFCIVDPSLNGFIGHHYEYDRSTAVAAIGSGYRPIILSHLAVDPQIAHEQFIYPTFRLDTWGTSKHFPVGSDDEIRDCNQIFFEDLETAIRRIGLPRRSVIFGHMITRRQLLGWARFAQKYARRGSAKLVLLLRYDSNMFEDEISRQAFRMLEKAARGGSVKLISDSGRLARQFEEMTTLTIGDVAIPHTTAVEATAPTTSMDSASRPLRFVSLGNARDEKGIFEIIEAIRTLCKPSETTRYEFILQCNDARPDVQRAVEQLAQLRLPGVRLIRDALSSKSYYDLLNSADVVLLPYWRSIYRARTSGVFMEAVTAGKVVICTEDSWMSDELEFTGSGLLCADRDVSDLVRCIQEATINYKELHSKALAARGKYLKRHNATRLVDQIIGGHGHEVDPERRSRVALFYPWADLASRNAGASVRVNLLLDFLEDHGFEVRVLAAGGSPGKRSTGVTIDLGHIGHPRDGSLRWLETISKVVSGSADGVYHPWFWLEAMRRRDFHARVRQVVEWADVCLLEYPYWANIVRKASRKQGIRHIMTDHDILSDQVKSWPLRLLTRWFEFRAMAKADAAVTVSHADQVRMAKVHINTTLIPNPTNTAPAVFAEQLDRLGILEMLFDLPANAQVCLFVGSGYTPNRLAVKRIREIAAKTKSAGRGRRVLFVTAGKCAEPERSDNFWALGSVDDLALRALYARARLVLIPLEEGTGVSVKSVEALALGKVILGTKVALRGLDIQSGRDCLIEDDLDVYPRLILEALGDEPRRALIAKNAKAFGENYDYRNLYKHYLPLLGVASATTVETTPTRRDLHIPPDLALRLLERALQKGQYDLGLQVAEMAGKQHRRNGAIALQTAHLMTVARRPLSVALHYLDRAIANGCDEVEVRSARRWILSKYSELGEPKREEAASICENAVE